MMQIKIWNLGNFEPSFVGSDLCKSLPIRVREEVGHATGWPCHARARASLQSVAVVYHRKEVVCEMSAAAAAA